MTLKRIIFYPSEHSLNGKQNILTANDVWLATLNKSSQTKQLYCHMMRVDLQNVSFLKFFVIIRIQETKQSILLYLKLKG